MPGKLRHGKAKYHTKKSKAKQRSTTLPSQQAVVMSPKPAVATSVSAPLEKVRTTEKTRTAAVSGAVRYPYITAELKRIGILAGIILVILIVLALVLS